MGYASYTCSHALFASWLELIDYFPCITVTDRDLFTKRD